ncbi:MAG: hypothetical protein ACE5EB_07435 [Thermodesulfobacteriota bacterium]
MHTLVFLSGLNWSGFWRPSVTNIAGSNINHIDPPHTGAIPFIALLFIIAALVFALLVIFRAKKPSQGAVFKSLVYASAFTALISAFRMDYNWAALYRDYSRRLAGKDTNQRLNAIDGNRFYTFLDSVKKAVPAGAAIRDLDMDIKKVGVYPYLATLRGNYLLLPVMTSKNGRFIWVHYKYSKFNYNLDTRTLQVAGSVFRARLYEYYDGEGALFEIIDGR